MKYSNVGSLLAVALCLHGVSFAMAGSTYSSSGGQQQPAQQQQQQPTSQPTATAGPAPIGGTGGTGMTRLGDVKVDVPRLGAGPAVGGPGAGPAPATAPTTSGAAGGGKPKPIASRAEFQRIRLRTVLEDLVGVPFLRQGRDPSVGVDTAGLVWHALKAIQVKVPDDEDLLMRTGLRLPAEDFVEKGKFKETTWTQLQTGDMLYFWMTDRATGKPALRPLVYLSEGKGLIASSSRGRVVLGSLEGKAKGLAFVQRVLNP